MAYGYICPKCNGTVDNNEFDYGKGICKECVEKIKQRTIKSAEAMRLASADAVQIEMEDIFECKLN